MNIMKHRKVILLAAALVLLIAVGVGGTLAYLTDKSDEVQNTFTPTSVGTDIEEDEFDGTTKKNVVIKNTGTADAYVRAMIVVTWQKGDNDVYVPAPVLGTDYTMSIGSNWQKADDGYYYYNGRVGANDQTTALITEAVWKAACENPDYHLHIEIIAESVQADGMGVSNAQDAFEYAAKHK